MSAFTAMSFILGAIALWGFLVLGTAIIAYRVMFCPRFHATEYTRNECLRNGDFDAAFLEKPWETARVPSVRGYDIATVALPAEPTKVEGAPAGTAIFVHGFTWSRYGMMKYMGPFVERGWNVVAFDLPKHGDSFAPHVSAPSFGYHEKDDLSAVITWTKARFGHDRPLVLVGESMGAATVLQYAPMGAPIGSSVHNIDAIIADCSFSSARNALSARMVGIGLPSFLAAPARPLVSGALKILRGFTLDDPAPVRSIAESDVPILFIHGTEDRYVPTSMSIEMAEERKTRGFGATELLLVSGARHAKSVLVNPDSWFSTVFAFIDRYVKNTEGTLISGDEKKTS